MTLPVHLLHTLEQPTVQHQIIAKHEQIELKNRNPFKPNIQLHTTMTWESVALRGEVILRERVN